MKITKECNPRIPYLHLADRGAASVDPGDRQFLPWLIDGVPEKTKKTKKNKNHSFSHLEKETDPAKERFGERISQTIKQTNEEATKPTNKII